MNRSIKLQFIVLLILAAALPAVAQNSSVLEGLKFPEVEGWKRGAVLAIPGEQDGIAVNYDSPARERVTVYVYTRGQKASDLKGIVKDEFDGARDAIKTVVDAGIYTDLKESKPETGNIGGAAGKVKALHVNMTFKVRGNPMTSEIFVFPYKGYVGKLRVTRPAGLDKASEDAYAKLLAAIEAVFAN